MMWIIAVVAIVLIASGFFLASGRMGRMPEAVDTRPAPRLPEGRFTGSDLRALRFPTVAGLGYAPNDVDNALERIAVALDSGDRARAVQEVRRSRFRMQRFGYEGSVVDDTLDLLVEREQPVADV